MGRYDFRPTRVHQTARELLATGRILHRPTWYRAVGQNPPPQILVRTQPVQHSGYGKQRPDRKVRSLFKPQHIRYPEDDMRKTFFSDHPWELARPRMLLEGNRLDGGEEWDSIRPKDLALQPENVVRRQLWLIEHEKKDPRTAYDIARREFYRERLREDIERKVAKEEALHVGAYFGQSTLSWGMMLEDRKFYGFKQWARRRWTKLENNQKSQEFGVGDESDPEVAEIENAAANPIEGLPESDADAELDASEEPRPQPIRPSPSSFRLSEQQRSSLRV